MEDERPTTAPDVWTLLAEELARVVPAFNEAFAQAVVRITTLGELLFGPVYVGKPLPPDVRPVRPRTGSATWLAWRDGRWVPVARRAGIGWVWLA